MSKDRIIRVPCNFRNGQKMMVPIRIGDSAVGTHPFEFQNKWLSSSKGGMIPAETLESYAKLKTIADTNRVSFADLCEFVSNEISAAKETTEERNRINALLNTEK